MASRLSWFSTDHVQLREQMIYAAPFCHAVSIYFTLNGITVLPRLVMPPFYGMAQGISVPIFRGEPPDIGD